MRGHVVEFRCHTHDAIELDHVYHASHRVHNLEYKAKRAHWLFTVDIKAVTMAKL